MTTGKEPNPARAGKPDLRIMFEGQEIDLSEFIEPRFGPQAEEEEEEQAPAVDNAHVEGEEVVPAKEEPKAAEPAKEEVKPTPEPEPPKEPEKKTYKIKYRGEELTVAPDDMEIVSALQMAKDYHTRIQEVGAKEREIDPYLHILKSDRFKEVLKEMHESGEIKPPEPKPQPEIDRLEYLKRKSQHDFLEVHSALNSYALTLDPEAYAIINSNFGAYVREFDAIAEKVRAAKAKPPEPERKPEPPKVDAKTAEKILRAKEADKKEAVVEKPGVHVDIDPRAEIRKREKELRRILKRGTQSERDDAAMELLLLPKV